MNSKIFRATLLTVLVLAAGALSLSAQDWRGKARVDGRVLNEKGEGIPDAKLTFRRNGAGPEAVVTKKNGRWAYLGLAGGSWEVDVEAPGYMPYKTTVQLSEVDRFPSMDIKLQPAPKAAPKADPAVPKNAAAEVIPILEHGNQLLLAKDFAGARAEYEKGLAAIPNNPIILKAIAQTYYGEKNLDKAIETLQKVVGIDPTDTTAQVLLGELQLEKGNVDEGQAILAKLPPDTITDSAVYVNLGIVLLNKKRVQEAWEYFDKAVKLAPAEADTYYYRGLTEMQLKKKAEARADFQKYLELAPTGDYAADVKEYLKSLK
jgi:tetratricopeptide (TPR) repeat protein